MYRVGLVHSRHLNSGIGTYQPVRSTLPTLSEVDRLPPSCDLNVKVQAYSYQRFSTDQAEQYHSVLRVPRDIAVKDE